MNSKFHIGIGLALAVGSVWLRLWIVNTSYVIHEVERSIGRAQQDLNQAQIKVASLKSPRRLELLARAKFQLGPPRADQRVQLGAPVR